MVNNFLAAAAKEVGTATVDARIKQKEEDSAGCLEDMRDSISTAITQRDALWSESIGASLRGEKAHIPAYQTFELKVHDNLTTGK